jgi:hypothetical protein
MTNKRINIAIAKACGWQIKVKAYHAKPPAGEWKYLDTIPDYCNDLNAMHEAEKALLKLDNSCGHWETYSNTLAAKLGCIDIFHATARQRAEAFLKIINKWEAKS